MCYVPQTELHSLDDAEKDTQSGSDKQHASVLIAVPARDDKKAEVYQFPEEKLRYVVPRAQVKDTGESFVQQVLQICRRRVGGHRSCGAVISRYVLTNAGMVMAVKLVQIPTIPQILVITGYEGGLTAVHLLPKADDTTIGVAQLVYLSQPHTQPVLSIDVLPDARMFYTSGADAIIAAHRIPETSTGYSDAGLSSSNQGHDGDPSASVPSQDPEALAPTIEDGDNAADDPPVSIPEDVDEQPLSFSKGSVYSSAPTNSAPKAGGLSSLLSGTTPLSRAAQPAHPQPSPPSIQAPSKAKNTKHAGQQSLSVRSDGRLLATGGWDSRVRIYSTKTLAEVAVLKWHKEGVYAVAFGEILDNTDLEHDMQETHRHNGDIEVARRETGLRKLQRQREEKMQVKHWIAAGAKDGKISLWEMF